MKIIKSVRVTLTLLLLGGCGTPSLYSQGTAPEKGGGAGSGKAQPSEAEMMAKMVELGKPGENQKLLATLVGSWDCKVTFWMAPGAPPSESSGTAVRKEIMDGRYFVMDTAAKMQMPGPDGTMHPVDFKGMEIDGYDNVKGKFFSTWIDSMGTGLF